MNILMLSSEDVTTFNSLDRELENILKELEDKADEGHLLSSPESSILSDPGQPAIGTVAIDGNGLDISIQLHLDSAAPLSLDSTLACNVSSVESSMPISSAIEESLQLTFLEDESDCTTRLSGEIRRSGSIREKGQYCGSDSCHSASSQKCAAKAGVDNVTYGDTRKMRGSADDVWEAMALVRSFQKSAILIQRRWRQFRLRGWATLLIQKEWRRFSTARGVDLFRTAVKKAVADHDLLKAYTRTYASYVTASKRRVRS